MKRPNTRPDDGPGRPARPLVPARIDGERLLLHEATRVGDDNVAEVVRDSDRIRRKIRDARLLRTFLEDCTTFLAMIRDYAGGSYRTIPFGSVAAIVGTLLYVLNPFDLVPDAIPGVGFIDDATVVAACLRLVATDLKKYRSWREGPGTGHQRAERS